MKGRKTNKVVKEKISKSLKAFWRKKKFSPKKVSVGASKVNKIKSQKTSTTTEAQV